MKNFSLFDERKAAQAAAFLLHKAKGSMHVLKLMKLLYLAERESLKRYGDSITGDEFRSMQNGPVLSTTLNFINGMVKPSHKDGWNSWIKDDVKHRVELKRKHRSLDQELLALSESDVECLQAVWEKFGGWTRDQLVEYTHSDACPEWQDPGYSSRILPTSRILKALGYSPEQVEALTKRVHEQRYISASFA